MEPSGDLNSNGPMCLVGPPHEMLKLPDLKLMRDMENILPVRSKRSQRMTQISQLNFLIY